MHINYPTVSKDQSNKFFITFYLNNRRYRLYSSKKIGGNTYPNKYKRYANTIDSYICFPNNHK